MAINCTLTVDDDTPGHGQTVTFTYNVDGNDPVDSKSVQIQGAGVFNGQRMEVSTMMTAPGTPAASEQFEVPTCSEPGWVFLATDQPNEFTCTIP